MDILLQVVRHGHGTCDAAISQGKAWARPHLLGFVVVCMFPPVNQQGVWAILLEERSAIDGDEVHSAMKCEKRDWGAYRLYGPSDESRQILRGNCWPGCSWQASDSANFGSPVAAVVRRSLRETASTVPLLGWELLLMLFVAATRSTVEGLQELLARPKSSMTAKVCCLAGAQL